MRSIILLLAVFVFAISCSPRIKSSIEKQEFKQLSTHTPVITLRVSVAVPEGSVFVGETYVGDTGFTTKCTYTEVLEILETEARKAGANIVSIQKIKKPSFASTCYRIGANLYRNTNIQLVNGYIEKQQNRYTSRLPENTDYAVVHFYRPHNPKGGLIGFKIRMDDETVIGRVRDGEKFSYKIKDFGLHKFWARTENITQVYENIERGKEYFFRCGINFGAVVGRANIEQVSPEIGIEESGLMGHQ